MDPELKAVLKRAAPSDLGERIKRARLAAGLTQGELGGEHASVPYISRIESGQRRPDPELLALLAPRLGVTVEQLLSGLIPEELPPSDRLQLDYAELALRSGEPERALALSGELLGRYASGPHPDFLEQIRLAHATGLEASGDVRGALDTLQTVVSAPSVGTATRVRASTALSRCYRDVGDLDRAVSVGEAVLEDLAAADLHHTDEALQLLATVAAAYFERGEVEHAASMCRRAVALVDESNSPSARAALYWNASVMQSEAGDTVGALPLAQKALALLEEADHQANVTRLRAQLAAMQLQLDPPEVEAATATLERVAAELETLGGSAVDRARTTFHLAKAKFLGHDLVTAQRLADDALAGASEVSPRLTADVLVLLGQLAAANDDLTAARSHFQQAALTLAAVGETMDRHTAQLWLDLANLLESVGLQSEALDAYRRSAASAGLQSRQVRPRDRSR
ncbi:helix-turn-helix domain-containing protein [Nocardioides mangrovi]|uniref:Helix-turn-helix domain-containing protein n=1 Tax=Nocardioides mangrovi TaxID=2874580 RepID=A0ABS7UB50_9ACTN|nr:helix-turn-helix domain-containing protein [Nocardioides mangrovi]MBZ5738220.1 helix-turn-helix domain-containing protein [Nocardioides mangrovi]